MIAINKSEKEALKKKFPNLHVVRTMIRDSKRHHYYCAESWKVLRYLDDIRKRNVVETHVGR